MIISDYRDAQAYEACRELSAAQWAWEFLRRNPAYQREWSAFDNTWRELEARYGRPPDRDFCAWKLDPRAWVPADACEGSDCRVDHDKVLIECALGARWGFYKFPPSPGDDDPVGEGRLVWREREHDVPLIDREHTDWLDDSPARMAIGFDLDLPLREQIERAKRLLQVMQRQRVRQGAVPPRSIRARSAVLTTMLRLLDARSAGADPLLMATIADGWEGLLADADALSGGNHLRLLSLPE